MPGVPSLQPHWCDECGKPEMAWAVSATNTDMEQNTDKDTESKTGSAAVVVGGQVETGTEEVNGNSSTISGGGSDPFYLCTDPTCDGYQNTFSDIIWWKLTYASDREYSDNEVIEITEKAVGQSIRDYRTVIDIVDELSDTKAADTIGDERRAEEAPPQQLGPCRCGKQQKPTQRYVEEIETEQQSEKIITRKMQSFKASVSAFLNLEVGGETTNGDETTINEISTISTKDTGTFPICPDLSCAERLRMFGMIECWQMRNDSSREYSDAKVDKRLENLLAQEIHGDKITTEAVGNVREKMFDTTAEQDPATTSSQPEPEASTEHSDDQASTENPSDPTNDSEEQSTATEDTASSTLTDPLYERLDDVDPTDEHAFEHEMLNDEIATLGGQYTRTEALVTQLEANTDTTESAVTQQQLLDQLAAMDTQNEESAAQIEQLTESVTGVDPELPQADDQLDLFAGQVADLEQHDAINTEQTTGTELQQLDTRLNAIDVDDEEIMQDRDSLQKDVALLEQRYERTEEKLTELTEQTTTEQREKTDSDQKAQSENTESKETEANNTPTEKDGTEQRTDTPASNSDSTDNEGDGSDGSEGGDGESSPTGETDTDKTVEPTQATTSQQEPEPDDEPTDPDDEETESEETEAESTVSDGAIAARLAEGPPSTEGTGTGTSNSTNKDNDRKGPDGSSV